MASRCGVFNLDEFPFHLVDPGVPDQILCMAFRVYLETTVLSYLVARPSRDVAVNAHQIATKLWWGGARSRFDLVVSAVTIDAPAAGDPDVARKRLALIADVPAVPVTPTPRSGSVTHH